MGENDRLDAAADDWLIGKVRGGDVDAYEELVRRHRDRIYRIALRMVGNPHDAEDVAQDVVVSLWTALTGFAGDSLFTTWLYRVVVNRCINLINRRPRYESLDDPDVGVSPGADLQVEAKGHARAALAAVTALPAELRAPVVLVDIEQMTYQEVAAILNVSEATVRGRLYRARRRLLDTLREWA
ncbi:MULTISPECIES: RNA polymerase sigma factor [Pseudonocardia]|uniref:RNA polymerase sigma factor n=1 Tax=Pseudonocardia TaxID=1847 RepID=UPI0031D3F984